MIKRNADVLSGAVGAAMLFVAITTLAGWPWAVGALGAALIAISYWMPQWD